LNILKTFQQRVEQTYAPLLKQVVGNLDRIPDLVAEHAIGKAQAIRANVQTLEEPTPQAEPQAQSHQYKD
jgi:hypothetical protein